MIETEDTIQLKEEASRALATNCILRSGFRDQVGTIVLSFLLSNRLHLQWRTTNLLIRRSILKTVASLSV
ncbi:hypothetical protein V6N13_087577 [Hibiscus sabdariffa]